MIGGERSDTLVNCPSCTTEILDDYGNLSRSKLGLPLFVYSPALEAKTIRRYETARIAAAWKGADPDPWDLPHAS